MQRCDNRAKRNRKNRKRITIASLSSGVLRARGLFIAKNPLAQYEKVREGIIGG